MRQIVTAHDVLLLFVVPTGSFIPSPASPSPHRSNCCGKQYAPHFIGFMALIKFAFFAISIYPLLIIQQQARAAPLCQDNSQCSGYDASYCSYDHIKKKCPQTCNLCGTISPSSAATSVTSSPPVTTITHSTMAVSQGLALTQSTMVVSQGLTPTQSTVVVSHGLTPTQSTVVISHDHDVSSAPTQNTKDLLRPTTGSYNSRTRHNLVRASTASTTNFTQENVLITLGILLSYFLQLNG
ncbi:hypothetical protein OS493_018051 [Desmophyllum pertusum]|uniref:ShKT domain-containing protein n=1 Tax=Desmophyllum pertusum TaxID=174260 RepID=A0A9W9Z305_9CNID|nr:hypothetical protein OS493_018051 [Desmophyllum pertusum]